MKPIKHLLVEDYIKSKTQRADNGCLLWADVLNGSGYASINKTRWHKFYGTSMAHQLAYVVAYGEYNKNLVISHICNNRHCCEPTHLKAVTQRENLQYRKQFGTYTEGINHGACKLTEGDVLLIRQKLVEQARGVDLAKEFKVSEATISEIKTRRKWRHI